MAESICEVRDCNDFADVVAHWPGHPIKACAHHLAAGRAIAKAMGFDLVHEVLPEAKARHRAMLKQIAEVCDVDLDQVERFSLLEMD